MDFESLLAQGPDVKAWLELPGTVIQYPVAQGEDNSYYLKHLYDGTANKVGCLFIDYENAEDFSDNNTIIYGHNMRDGSMFSALVEYKAQAYYDEHPEMYLVTPEGGYVVEVCGKPGGIWQRNFSLGAGMERQRRIYDLAFRNAGTLCD